MPELIETAPKLDGAIAAIEPLVEEWRASHAISSSRLPRRAQRDAAHLSLQGLLAALPRTSIEPRGLAVAGVAPPAVRAMPSCLSAGRWAEERLWHQHGQAVAPDLVPTTGS